MKATARPLRFRLNEVRGVGRKTEEKLQAAGVETLEDLRIRGVKTVAAETNLHESRLRAIAGQAELEAYGVPSTAAIALVRNEVVARAGEFTALDPKTVSAVLEREIDDPEIAIDPEAVSEWQERVPRLTLDETETTALGVEEKDDAVADESVDAGRAEEPTVSGATIRQSLETLRTAIDRREATLDPTETIDLRSAQQLVSSLVDEVTLGVEGLGPDRDGFETVFEDAADTMVDEATDIEAQIARLADDSDRIETRLSNLERERELIDEGEARAMIAESPDREFEDVRTEEATDE